MNKDSKSTNIAGKVFQPSDYEGKSQLEKGMAETHEQMSDDYYQGTIDQKLEKK